MANARLDGYRGIWFSLGQIEGLYGDKYSGGLGTYTAKHVPVAVHSQEADKTFFVYGGTPRSGERHLLNMVSYYDHRQHQVPRPVVVHDKGGVDDPHDNASITMDGEGYLWIFVSGRSRKRPGFKYRSRAPHAIHSFEQVATQEMTYPQPWWLTGHGVLHLYTRYSAGRELYWEASPEGRRGCRERKLAGFGGHYQISAARGSRVATAFNWHPGGNVDRRANLYYLESPDGGEGWTTVRGETVTTPLSSPANEALVVDSRAAGELIYLNAMAFDAEGRPVLQYVTSRGYAPGPANDPREWRITRWDGRRWRTATITRSDHNYDTGSLYIDGAGYTVIGPTEPGPQPHHTGGEMAMWRSRNGGETWRRSRLLTAGSAYNHMYARAPVNARDPFLAFWADGDPTGPSPSHLYFCSSRGTVWQLPYEMGQEAAEPTLVTPR